MKRQFLNLMALASLMKNLSKKLDRVLELLAEPKKAKPPEIYRDADYVMDRVGISRRTLGRCQGAGMIKPCGIEGRRRLFSDEDVEQFHREYRSL
jgi:hypothetical protein